MIAIENYYNIQTQSTEYRNVSEISYTTRKKSCLFYMKHDMKVFNSKITFLIPID